AYSLPNFALALRNEFHRTSAAACTIDIVQANSGECLYPQEVEGSPSGSETIGMTRAQAAGRCPITVECLPSSRCAPNRADEGVDPYKGFADPAPTSSR